MHYAPNLTAEEAKKICPEIDDWYKALCNHLSHLDYSRNEDTSSPFKIAYPIYSALKKILIQFKKYIEPQYKSSQLMELIKVMEQE